MGKALVVLMLTIGILLGGFYLFFYQGQGEIVVNESSESVEAVVLDEVIEEEDVVAVLDTSNWLDYQYMTKQLIFTTKYPAELWKVVEQDHADELNLIFTNGDSCQVLYTFDLEGEAYNFDLANNNDLDECATVLQKIVAYASLPKFGIAAASLYAGDEDLEEDSEDIDSEEDLGEDDETIDDSEEEIVSDDDDLDIEEEEEEEVVEEEDITVNEETDPSAGISDQEIVEMSSEDRYKMVKEFVHEYLLEFAKRHWDYVESKLSAKAIKALGSDTLSSVVNTYYYYEVLNFISEVSETQYTTNVKFTDKEEEPIGDGSGVYKLNIVWENGEWKIDNYLFE